MVLIVKLVSIALIVYGCVLLLRTSLVKKILEYMKEKNRPLIASAIKAVLGVIFLIAAHECRVPWVIFFVGALALLSGIAAFLVKKEAVIKVIDWAEKKASHNKYLIGAIILFWGALIAIGA